MGFDLKPYKPRVWIIPDRDLLELKSFRRFDPKMLVIDPKTTACLAAMDPKELAKVYPSLVAMYVVLMGIFAVKYVGKLLLAKD